MPHISRKTSEMWGTRPCEGTMVQPAVLTQTLKALIVVARYGTAEALPLPTTVALLPPGCSYTNTSDHRRTSFPKQTSQPSFLTTCD